MKNNRGNKCENTRETGATKLRNSVKLLSYVTEALSDALKASAHIIRKGDYLPCPGALKYLKNSEFGSTTSTSLLVLKLAR